MANINVNQTNASETAKGIVEEATQAQLNAGTDTGETGAKLFAVPSKILAIVNNATNYPTPLNADKIGIWDVANSLFKSVTWANIKATLKTYFDALYAVKTFVENISFQDSTTGITAQTYTLELYAAYAYTINELKIISGSGTATAAIQINGVDVTNISAVAVSNVIATGTASGANTVVVGDKITLVITAPSSLNNLQASLKTTRT